MPNKEHLVNLGTALSELFLRSYASIIGIFTMIAGYFLPIQETIHIILFFFILDVIFGYRAAHRKDKTVKFSPRIIWDKTIPKMLISFLLIITAHMLDGISPKGIITIREAVGWFVAGLILTNVWQNMFDSVEWKGIKGILNIILNSVYEKFKVKVD